MANDPMPEETETLAAQREGAENPGENPGEVLAASRKTIYLVRHCQATGQAPEAPLTEKGKTDSRDLAGFLENFGIERLVSSPYLRAVQSFEPLAERLGLSLETDPRFGEWVLSGTPFDSYEEYIRRIRASFADPTLLYPGGESGKALTERALTAMADLLSHPAETSAVCLHGGILSHLLRHYNPEWRFEDWQALTNPDVYRLIFQEDGFKSVARTWEARER